MIFMNKNISSLFKAIAGGTCIRIVGMGLGFLVGIQLPRLLGTEGYGVYGLVVATISMLIIPTELGIPRLVTREVAAAKVKDEWGKINGITKWAVGFVVQASVILFLICAIFTLISRFPFFAGGIPQSSFFAALLVGFTLIPIVSISNVYCAKLRGLHQIVLSQIPEIIVRPGLFSTALFVTTFFSSKLNPETAIFLSSGAALISMSISKLLVDSHSSHSSAFTSIKIERSEALLLLKSSIPMALTDGARILQTNLVIFIMGLFVSSDAVGIYKAAASLSLLIAMPITLINITCSSMISRLYTEGNIEEIQPLLAWASLSATVATFLLSVPIMFFGTQVTTLLFGIEFSGSAHISQILCMGIVFSSVFGCAPTLLNMTGHERVVTKTAGVSVLLLLFSAPVLIYFFGIIGAALSASFAMVTWGALMRSAAFRQLGLESSLVHSYIRKKLKQ